MSVYGARALRREPVAGLAAEVAGAAAPAAQALLLLSRLLARPASHEPAESARAPFLSLPFLTARSTRPGATRASVAPGDSVILVYLFVDE